MKFAVIQRHEEEGATQEHELASFEAMMLPCMDAAHNLARWFAAQRTGCAGCGARGVSACVQILRGIPWLQWSGLVLTIVRNTSYTLLKKNRAADLTTAFDEEIQATGYDSASPATILEHAEDAELIKNAMDGLPAEFREILILRHQENLSYNEIGDIPRFRRYGYVAARPRPRQT